MTKSTGKRIVIKGKSPKEYLYAKMRVNPHSGCWEWAGVTYGRGYGAFRHIAFDSVLMPASRASWMIHFGPIENDLHVLHRCDNRKCVNPDHLFLGTNQDNVDDCLSKMRHSYGVKRYNAKLDDEKVVEMRMMRSLGHSYEEIARKFGVNRKVCERAIKRISWKHVS